MEHFEFYLNIMVVAIASLASTLQYLCLMILTNNEECHFLCSTTCLGQMYKCVMNL